MGLTHIYFGEVGVYGVKGDKKVTPNLIDKYLQGWPRSGAKNGPLTESALRSSLKQLQRDHTRLTYRWPGSFPQDLHCMTPGSQTIAKKNATARQAQSPYTIRGCYTD